MTIPVYVQLSGSGQLLSSPMLGQNMSFDIVSENSLQVYMSYLSDVGFIGALSSLPQSGLPTSKL